MDTRRCNSASDIDKRLNKPERGHRKPSGFDSPMTLREVEADDVADFRVGSADQGAIVFTAGELVDITGTSKGRGFQGGVKRHGFRGGPKTHGQSDRHCARPARSARARRQVACSKGMRMAGHMGNERVTMQNLTVIRVDTERNLLLVQGSVPGPNKGIVMVRRAIKGQAK